MKSLLLPFFGVVAALVLTSCGGPAASSSPLGGLGALSSLASMGGGSSPSRAYSAPAYGNPGYPGQQTYQNGYQQGKAYQQGYQQGVRKAKIEQQKAAAKAAKAKKYAQQQPGYKLQGY